MRTYGPAYDPALDAGRLRTQMEAIRDVLLRAADARDDGAWLSLREIELLTHAPQASISAQLRHLRKPQFGAWVVEKRRRGAPERGVWEYRLGRPAGAAGDALPSTDALPF
jgi:hypothetical protein